MKEKIRDLLPTECPWRDTLYWYDTIDSTNTRAKEMAAAGAVQGTVLIAATQTGGRGRLGRTFQSPDGMGVYLSVILRPDCPPQELMHLTCAVAVAMCDAVEICADFRPGIKWTNDLVWGKLKLGGILTELQVSQKTGLVEYAVVGIGINCCQQRGDFPKEIADMAASVSMAAGRPVDPQALTACMITSLQKMASSITEKEAMLKQYRSDCVTLGKQIRILQGDLSQYATALDIDSDGALVVRMADGTLQAVSSGEVSIRGMYGYT